MITILGPTATGKTAIAAALARKIGGEIISADSRQVYRRMDIGTGKDLGDYGTPSDFPLEGETFVPYHLIDICEPGTVYNVYEFQKDFHRAYDDITSRGKLPILCGGTGLYIESVLSDYDFGNSRPSSVSSSISPESGREPALSECGEGRQSAAGCSDGERLIFGVQVPREVRRERITRRLYERLDEGMVAEIQGLINEGVDPEQLIRYGLEYKFVTQYLLGQTTYEEMVNLLEIAIHQFAKRQMTWFRGMEERRGFKIHWIDGMLPLEDKVKEIMRRIPAVCPAFS